MTNLKLLENTSRYRKTPKGILTNIYNKQRERSRVKNICLPSYSLKELHEKYLNNRRFKRLYSEWIERNYDKQFKPSIDRINCVEPYTLNNIHKFNSKKKLIIVPSRLVKDYFL